MLDLFFTVKYNSKFLFKLEDKNLSIAGHYPKQTYDKTHIRDKQIFHREIIVN